MRTAFWVTNVAVSRGHPQVLARAAPTQISSRSSSTRGHESPQFSHSRLRAAHQEQWSLNESCAPPCCGQGRRLAPQASPSPIFSAPSHRGDRKPLREGAEVDRAPSGEALVGLSGRTEPNVLTGAGEGALAEVPARTGNPA